jgi:predicted LPLAT superfamily acyltransferase
MKFGVSCALRLGRPTARIFLYPICLYFLFAARHATCASREYLARALGRSPRLADIFRHYLTFASCILDRIYLLNDEVDQFDIRIEGEETVLQCLREGSGCILFGAHFGSFEVLRALGRRYPNVSISLLMYEENARKVRSALAAINPRLTTEIISLGRLDSFILAADRLKGGHFVGLLVDRTVRGEDLVRHPFLGELAYFPRGPFRMAMLLRRPVVMMVAMYRGGRTYEVVFDKLMEPAAIGPSNRNVALDLAMRRYVERLEQYCKQAPFNWFNFYPFWS